VENKGSSFTRRCCRLGNAEVNRNGEVAMLSYREERESEEQTMKKLVYSYITQRKITT